ncbi:FYVE/PHD zinc finger protein, partial [Fragilariopsis cylindrus CCMP1102]
WMPDRLCKTCYSCDAPFTVFRRRHHCRICGQVFCNTCSGYFVPASSNNIILRTCKMCFDQV